MRAEGPKQAILEETSSAFVHPPSRWSNSRGFLHSHATENCLSRVLRNNRVHMTLVCMGFTAHSFKAHIMHTTLAQASSGAPVSIAVY